MQIYQNLGRDSGVDAYEAGANYILVRFKTGDTYKYNYNSAGASHIEKMKNLAAAGSGLNSYINKYVKYNYVK